MIIPKRFKLDKGASTKAKLETGMDLDCVHVREESLLVSDGQGAAVVPILPHSDTTGRDLPKLEDGEIHTLNPVPLQAIKEATKGKTGLGTLRTGTSSTEAQSAPGKPWIRVANPEPVGQVPNFDEALERTESQAPPTHRYVEVCLDAQLLANIAAAIGAEEAVKLRFLVDNESGRADASGLAHGVVDVRPVREPNGGRGVLMIQVISPS